MAPNMKAETVTAVIAIFMNVLNEEFIRLTPLQVDYLVTFLMNLK
jgi:hypothetical protein